MQNQGYHEILFDQLKDTFVNIDYNDWTAGRSFRAHWQERVEILVVVEGSLDVFCDGVEYDVKQGEAIFINPYQIHSGIAGEQGVKNFVITTEYIHFVSNNMDAGDRLMLQFHNNEKKICNHIKNAEIFDSLVELANFKYQNFPYQEVVMRGKLLAALGNIMRFYTDSSTDDAKATLPQKNIQIGAILEYINEHYREDISSQMLAEHFGFSHSYFCRYFKKSTGETLSEYINDVRMSYARHFLLDYSKNYSVIEVAEMVGYTNVSYFNNQFKERMGDSPTKYRKQWISYNKWAEQQINKQKNEQQG